MPHPVDWPGRASPLASEQFDGFVVSDNCALVADRVAVFPRDIPRNESAQLCRPAALDDLAVRARIGFYL